MKWEHPNENFWRAIGDDGSFFIEKSGKRYWVNYVSKKNKPFRMPPFTSIKAAKEAAEDNAYWEN